MPIVNADEKKRMALKRKSQTSLHINSPKLLLSKN